MKTIADPHVLDRLLVRLAQVAPESPRRWGKMSAAEMLCHLGDASDLVLQRRILPGAPAAPRSRPVIKWLALKSPIPWPRGYPTRPGIDPKREGTKPAEFEADRSRVAQGIRDMASANAETFATTHLVFGPMRLADWHRWAYLHVDHHLRQFGV